MSIKPMQLTALSFSKEGHRIVSLASFVKRSKPSSWQLITPQLMGRAVSPPAPKKLDFKKRRNYFVITSSQEEK